MKMSKKRKILTFRQKTVAANVFPLARPGLCGVKLGTVQSKIAPNITVVMD